MNAEEILEIIPYLQLIENNEDIKLVKNAINSCLVVQELKKVKDIPKQ
ncbi:hypothetical protein [uncultured Clostridium sp.]|nr:hypothetical protein [uncultured Clostridium sp.]